MRVLVRRLVPFGCRLITERLPVPVTSVAATRSSTTAAFRHLDKISIEGPDEAMELASRLNQHEQELLRKALEEVRRHKPATVCPLSREQTRSLFLVNSLPFVGFGFLDNMIMIFAGEFIDQKLGIYLCLSTMAAAALGNLISDVAGVGLAHYVEILVNKAGIKHPVLTAEQLEGSKARWTTNLGRAFGLSVGCILGMFPLLFYDEEAKKTNAKEEETNA